ncbi:MAG: hypothetical protein JW866_00020 [Ignavibacteriales bacterium]|nr:hypothetical protein [Ignavibacteriales bacterium]
MKTILILIFINMTNIKTKKKRDTEILEHKIAKEDKLIANWEKYNISQEKIDRMLAQRNKHAEKLDKVKNS